MADSKISQLDSVTSISDTGDELFVLEQSGKAKSMTASILRTWARNMANTIYTGTSAPSGSDASKYSVWLDTTSTSSPVMKFRDQNNEWRGVKAVQYSGPQITDLVAISAPHEHGKSDTYHFALDNGEYLSYVISVYNGADGNGMVDTVNGLTSTDRNVDTDLIYNNVDVTDWHTSGSGYSDYPAYGDITVSGVTSKMLADVVFSYDQISTGNFAPFCNTYTNKVRIYAKDATDYLTDTVTIPTIHITVGKVVS